MATYKSEALHQKYAGRLRRRAATTRSAGCPRWARMAAAGAPLANRMLRGRAGRPAGQGGGRRRPAPVDCPAFAPKPLRRSAPTAPLAGATPDVWIWADSFTDHFAADNGRAAIELLESVGLTRAR